MKERLETRDTRKIVVSTQEEADGVQNRIELEQQLLLEQQKRRRRRGNRMEWNVKKSSTAIIKQSTVYEERKWHRIHLQAT